MSQSTKQIIAVVPAAGIGSRMGAEVPKQYLALNEQTILGHTLDCLLSHAGISTVIIALHPQDKYFSTLPQATHPKLLAVIGGNERADSVLAALQHADEDSWVLVHDAARPCLSHADIDKLIASSSVFPQGAILGAPVRDTMKRSKDNGEICNTVCRDKLWHALTPQYFPVKPLRDNLKAALAAGALITDEASAMEWAGIMPGIISGRADNIKVTHPDDLQLASLFLKNLSSIG
ncbi:2-C-methyl-D-erythritol 4-phosphate cytidylyltransferase [Shewanella sp. Choline-02u-19]|uniref:2-C-methyl-D-erythritol 4-phosphate cytidylyltransferase n=1 Tax=unclassified Shewanella TaxID=196818 RepID=UPI000C349FF6|nr:MULTISPECIES: 2-C-methyl-D-erythritol 4-phosphate cytidylyltransferase [unclassified Shewanella]PKG55545.1 2-C-methyl-D-erythritol 4-phosphate cytidylyltransferase [Shewanella sp. GutDb-MelDb]PKH57406.1 2-C-methyl-D-erythritol 4-phosphate cytidylyltransferase [Shewanella sp. Bg11-22]PKI28293.1 2-C-methyl-D-erythritol 4-phosphate cytidylyltransferase [Shewanella sp. Choline-02u-19]